MSVLNSGIKITRPERGEIECFNDGGTNGATDGGHAALGASTTYEYVFSGSVLYATNRVLCVKNGTNQSVTVSIQQVVVVDNPIYAYAGSFAVAAGAIAIYAPGTTGGSGAITGDQTWLCDAWGVGSKIRLLTGTDPTSGAIEIAVVWRG